MEAKAVTNCTSAPSIPTNSLMNHTNSLTSKPGQWSSAIGAQKDLSMAELPLFPSRAKGETRAKTGKPLEEATPPKNKLFFGLPGLDCRKHRARKQTQIRSPTRAKEAKEWTYAPSSKRTHWKAGPSKAEGSTPPR
ncbi:unnamed protein product [Sphagnum balticum]